MLNYQRVCFTVQTKALQSPKLCPHFLGSPRLFSELLELPELGVQAMPGPSAEALAFLGILHGKMNKIPLLWWINGGLLDD